MPQDQNQEAPTGPTPKAAAPHILFNTAEFKKGPASAFVGKGMDENLSDGGIADTVTDEATGAQIIPWPGDAAPPKSNGHDTSPEAKEAAAKTEKARRGAKIVAEVEAAIAAEAKNTADVATATPKNSAGLEDFLDAVIDRVKHGQGAEVGSTALTPIKLTSRADYKLKLPHRRWLYGVDLLRGEVSIMGAPGGVGKTAIAIGWAIDVVGVAGRSLFGQTIFGKDHKAIYINAEDGGVEIHRRAEAAEEKYKIAKHAQDRLYILGTDDPLVKELAFMRSVEKGTAVLNRVGFQKLEELIMGQQPSLVVLDPLIAFCGGGNVSDNPIMALVMLELKRLAIKYDCAILVIHHTKKGGDPNNAELILGAASIGNIARRAIMPVPMTDEEATYYNILPSDKWRFLKVVDAKANNSPRTGNTPWYELHSVELSNPEPPIYMNGDSTQVAVRVELEAGTTAILKNENSMGPEVQKALLDLIDQGITIGGKQIPYSPTVAGAKNDRSVLAAAMAVVHDKSARKWGPKDLEAITKRAIDGMKAARWLITGAVNDLIPKPDRSYGRSKGLKVDWVRTPWPQEAGAADATAPAGRPAQGN